MALSPFAVPLIVNPRSVDKVLLLLLWYLSVAPLFSTRLEGSADDLPRGFDVFTLPTVVMARIPPRMVVAPV